MPEQSGFTLHTTLVFPDRSSIAQGFTVEQHTGDLYATQDTDGTLVITRFERTPHADSATFPLYTPTEEMRVKNGGHGDLTFDVELVNGQICTSFVDHNADLWRIPFQPGKDVLPIGKPIATNRLPVRGHDGTVLVRRYLRGEDRPYHFLGPRTRSVDMKGQGTRAAVADAGDRLFRIHQYGWIQGIAFHRGVLYTLRGSPRLANGWLYDGAHVLPYIERRQAIEDPMGLLLTPWPVDMLGWENGKPVGGKVEPEGTCVALLDGKPNLLIGIATGHHFDASYSLMIVKRAL